jgi:formate/nitrite transporter
MSLNTPPDIAKALEGVGTVKCGLSFYKMFMLAILAGVYIGFGAILATTVTAGIPTSWGGVKNFLSGSVFCVGLILVVLGGAELFTGNNLISIALCSKKVKIGGVLKNWIVVWIGNFAGSLLLAVIYFATGLWKGTIGTTAVVTASTKANLMFNDVFFRGILCNVLVCLAVWISISAKDTIGKIFAIYFPIMAFVAMGFEHSVANMYFIPIGIFINTASPTLAPASVALTTAGWAGAFSNIIAATLGNMVGGVILVGVMYWSIYLRQGRNAASCAPGSAPAAAPASEQKK